MADLRILAVVLLVLAALLRSELFFYLLYLVVGLQLAAWFWLSRVSRQLSLTRAVPPAAFPNEAVEVTLVVRNNGALPIPWLALHESIPPALRTPPAIRRVVALAPRQELVIRYLVQSRRRGLYRLGPLNLRSGDVFGMRDLTLGGAESQPLTIYPQILPLPTLGLPAGLPFGIEADPYSLFIDPARPIGTRTYMPGDGLSQIDWKSSAHAGSLRVRRYEPAIARTTLIALAFSRNEYPGRFVFDNQERAIVTAASIAADLVARRQAVGLCVSGIDPLSDAVGNAIMPGNGRSHLIALLSLLGRLESAAAGDIAAELERHVAHLGWGTTVVLITSDLDMPLLARLLPLRRFGIKPTLVLIDAGEDAIGRARRHGIAVYLIDRAGLPQPT
ncbi:MAG: DUF58 domain-containing protein [Oscillochloris sp.]|nr:DUF58 domain-containing protein [Oscillochloris sp.]